MGGRHSPGLRTGRLRYRCTYHQHQSSHEPAGSITRTECPGDFFHYGSGISVDRLFSPFQGTAPTVSDSHTGHSASRIYATLNSWQAISCRRMAAVSFPQPQRTVQQEIPQTPRTQLIRSQLEQQNFEMMNSLQQKNQQQIKDLSAQLQTGLQAFLQQSMEQMFTRLAPAQTQQPAATSQPPHIVSITPVSASQPKAEEPMDSAPSQPAPSEVKKGLTKVKGFPAIAKQSIQAVVTNVKVPTTTPSAQPSSMPSAAPAPRLLFKPWNKRNTGLMLQLPPSLPPQNRKILQMLRNRSKSWSKRLGNSCPFLTQQQKRTTSWAQHWGVIPFSYSRKSRIDPHLSSSLWLPTYLSSRLPRMT